MEGVWFWKNGLGKVGHNPCKESDSIPITHLQITENEIKNIIVEVYLVLQ